MHEHYESPKLTTVGSVRSLTMGQGIRGNDDHLVFHIGVRHRHPVRPRFVKLGGDRGVRRESRRPPVVVGARLSLTPSSGRARWRSRPAGCTDPSRRRRDLDRSGTPREALDDAIRSALVHGPCYVTFSGGRDSSAVLAAATALARREGHALPVPVTRIYPDLPDTDESDWQRAVIDHLGLTEWVRLELRDGESELLGPAARDALEPPRSALAARAADATA